MLLDYELPTHVILQKDALAEHAQLIAAMGQHAMLVMDAGLDDAHPAKQEILFCLDFNDIERTIYLHTRKVAPGIANLEAGKGIALLAAQSIDNATLLQTDIARPLPIVCIPTEPGSGTEVTPEIHVAQSGLDRLTLVRNPLASPKLSLLDPRYTLHMPRDIVVSNYIKSLGRAVEAVTSEKANPISDAIAIAALGTASELADKLNDPETDIDEDIHEQLMLAANQAGLAIAASGANLMEALASPLTYVSPVHLGQAYGLILPPVLSYLIERAPLVSDVIMQSLYVNTLEDLEDCLWNLIGEITPITPDDLERCANAAAANPLIKNGVLSLEFKEIASCYAHLLAE